MRRLAAGVHQGAPEQRQTLQMACLLPAFHLLPADAGGPVSPALRGERQPPLAPLAGVPVTLPGGT